MPRADRSNALRVVLTILMAGAGGLVLFLVVLVAAGIYFSAVDGGMDPALAGLAPGKPAPAIAADAWVNGEPSSLDGKVVVVQGWFYNCPYCWKEAPKIAELHEKFGDRVAFVALSSDPGDDAAKVEEFVSTNKVAYPVGYGMNAAVTMDRGFEGRAYPAIWVIGKDGMVLWNRSLEGDQSLEEAIEAALKGEAA